MGAFKGMVGRILAQQQLREQMKANAARAGKAAAGTMNGGHTGKYLFVAHPNCCPRCNALGATPHFFNTPDVAYITHPNCLCATIEVPAGLQPNEIMQWALHPYGVMRSGWNYGVPLNTTSLTEENIGQTFADWNRRAQSQDIAARRAAVSQRRINMIRRGIANGTINPNATDLTSDIIKQGNAFRNQLARQRRISMRGRPVTRPSTIPTMTRPVSAAPQIDMTKRQMIRGSRSMLPAALLIAGAMAMNGYNEERKRKRREAKKLRGRW